MKTTIHELLEVAYQRFPRKMGKSQGFKLALRQCKSVQDVSDLANAIEHYRAHVAREGTEAQYILYFSTFMSQWRDWLDPEHGTVEKQKIDLTGVKFDDTGGVS